MSSNIDQYMFYTKYPALVCFCSDCCSLCHHQRTPQLQRHPELWSGNIFRETSSSVWWSHDWRMIRLMVHKHSSEHVIRAQGTWVTSRPQTALDRLRLPQTSEIESSKENHVLIYWYLQSVFIKMPTASSGCLFLKCFCDAPEYLAKSDDKPADCPSTSCFLFH